MPGSRTASTSAPHTEFAGDVLVPGVTANQFCMCHYISVRCATPVRNLSLNAISSSQSLVYLGANLASDGRLGSELAQKLGTARSDFRALSKVWRHSNLSTTRKIEIYRAVVESRLLYGLSSSVLTKAQRRQVDGVQARFLRSILGILPSHLSRVSNQSVRGQAGCIPVSTLLLQRQLIYLGKVLRQDTSSLLRRASFIEGTLQPATSRFIRRIGRPRFEWVSTVLPHALRLAGGLNQLETAVQDKDSWKLTVKSLL